MVNHCFRTRLAIFRWEGIIIVLVTGGSGGCVLRKVDDQAIRYNSVMQKLQVFSGLFCLKCNILFKS